MLGGRPAHGRPLNALDDAGGAPPVVMVSHHLWSTALDADPAAVGRTIWVNGFGVTLVGVMRPDFTGPIEPACGPRSGRRWRRWTTCLVEGRSIAIRAWRSDVTARLTPDVSARARGRQSLGHRQPFAAALLHDDPSRSVRLDSLASPIAGRDAAEDYVGIVTIFAHRRTGARPRVREHRESAARPPRRRGCRRWGRAWRWARAGRGSSTRW